MNSIQPALAEAQRAIGAVLEALEAETGADVQDIALENLVDIDPKTGAPVVQKGVEIKLLRKPVRRWAT